MYLLTYVQRIAIVLQITNLLTLKGFIFSQLASRLFPPDNDKFKELLDIGLEPKRPVLIRLTAWGWLRSKNEISFGMLYIPRFIGSLAFNHWLRTSLGTDNCALEAAWITCCFETCPFPYISLDSKLDLNVFNSNWGLASMADSSRNIWKTQTDFVPLKNFKLQT